MIHHYNIKTTDDIKDTFKDMFGEAIQEIMEAELDTHLGYVKNSKEAEDTANRRNGTLSINRHKNERKNVYVPLKKIR